MKDSHLAEPDKVTQAAFNKIWRIRQAHLDIQRDPNEWSEVLNAVAEIFSQTDGSLDPEFITDFGIDAIKSLERISRLNEANRRATEGRE